jgi:chromosome segregation ATPase
MEIIHPAAIIGDILKSVSSETNITSAPMENPITSNTHQTVSYQQQEAKCYIELIEELQKELTISQNKAHSLRQNELKSRLKLLKEIRNLKAELDRQIHSKLAEENETIKKFAALVGELQKELSIMEAKAASLTISENQLIEVINHLKAEFDHINGENNFRVELLGNLEQRIYYLEEEIEEFQKEKESLLKKPKRKFKNLFKKKEKKNKIRKETKPSLSEKIFDKKEKLKRGAIKFRDRITSRF